MDDLVTSPRAECSRLAALGDGPPGPPASVQHLGVGPDERATGKKNLDNIMITPRPIMIKSR
jgi:hypothetical protein